MAHALGISRNTVTAGYERLRADGWVSAVVGSGTFVKGPPLQSRRAVQETGASTMLSCFAKRALAAVDVERIPGSAIPGLRYSLQYGAPYNDALLSTAWGKCLRQASGYTEPGYHRSQGLSTLRAQLSEYLARRRGVIAEPDDILVVGGVQQGIALANRVLVNAGESVVIEEPHYTATRFQLQAHGAKLHAEHVDQHGLVLERMQELQPKAIFVTPSHQFPLGVSLSEARRDALLRFAAEHSSWIVEDDYDGDYHHGGCAVSTLKSMDRVGRVIYIGTFSKTMFPDLRMGYMVVPPNLRRAFITAKYLEDMGSPAIEQAAMAQFMASGAFDRHLVRSGKELRARRDRLLRHLGNISDLHVHGASAGMHVVVTCTTWTARRVEQIIESGRRRGLGLYPLSPYFVGDPSMQGLVIGYASLSPTQIDKAMALFVLSLNDAMEG